MANLTTQAVVLRHADYRENDRMLTLLSPTHGRLEALARGCRKPGSPLMSASELFTTGEYVLYQSRGRATVVSCDILDTFYSVREDYDRLVCASAMLQVLEAEVVPEQPEPKLYMLLLRSLKRLCYTALEPRAVTAAFLLMNAALTGYRPRLSHCVRCGKDLEGLDAFLDVAGGGLLCASCARETGQGLPMTRAQAVWLRDVIKNGVEGTTALPGDAPLSQLIRYTESILDIRLTSGRELAKL